MSRVLGITVISTVPNSSGQVHLVDYLSHRGAFGDGYDTMREHLQRSVEAFEGGQQRQDLPGTIGWTTRFIVATVPNQAWLCGTSSFRLDRTADLLSAAGPNLYFRDGLQRDYTADDARRFADEIFEEVLGVYHPPTVRPASFDAYTEAALALNRDAADAACLDCAADIGRQWGTLLALGGFTEGESFVARNVGLKSRWQNGSWRVRMCFMDHDGMRSLGTPGERPNPAWQIEGMRKDSDWICDGPNTRGEFTCLREIYRTTEGTQAQAMKLFRARVASAHFATRNAMQSGPLRVMFDPDYVASLAIRDELIGRYLSGRGSGQAVERWKRAVRTRIKRTIFPPDSIPEFIDAVIRNAHRLERYAFLYESR